MTAAGWTPTRFPIEQVSWPDIAPTKANRTAAIWNTAYKPGDDWYGQNLWLTKVTTGWHLSGNFGQSQKNRIFYPHNLSQAPITIEGQMPNQYQYDRLVYFIKRHHGTALNGTGSVQSPLTFALPAALMPLPGKNLGTYSHSAYGPSTDTYWDGDKIVKRYYRSMYVDGYITGIKAGHPRWNFAPKFTMDLMVSYDYIDEKVHLANQLSRLVSSRGSTYAKDNAALTKNYHAALFIDGKGGVNDLAPSLTDNREGGKELTLNQQLEQNINIATESFGDIG